MLKQFETMISTMGVFSRISLYYWDTTQEEPTLYYDKALSRVSNESNIIVDNQRNLVWVISDCIGLSWKSGAAFKHIQRWSTQSLTSIMHMFPKEMWMGTMLYKGKHSPLSSTVFNPLNKNLTTQRRRKKANRLKIPVISFNPYALQAWAKMVVHKQGNQISGVEFDSEALTFAYHPPVQQEITTAMRMKRFYSQASPTAQKLAFYMSVLPVDFQVTRILQEEYLTQSNQAHVAEVFLGGLIEKKNQGKTIRYDFYPEIREALNANISADESVDIMHNMSAFVQGHLGIGVDFSALMHDPDAAFVGDEVLSDDSIAYARIAASVLQRKGGRFAENAAKIDKNIKEKVSSYRERALHYQSEGNYEKALLFYKGALATNKKILGEWHIDTAISYDNLAEIYQYQLNDYSSLCEEHQEDQQYFEHTRLYQDIPLGTDDPWNYPDFDGGYFDEMEEFDKKSAKGEKLNKERLEVMRKALAVRKKGLEIRRKSLGEQHPDTATSYNNLAVLYKSQGKVTQALPLYEKALAIREKTLGEQHPNTINSYNNLAKLYQKKGDINKALVMYEKVLTIKQKSLGEQHPDIVNSYSNLAKLYQEKGNIRKALDAYEKILTTQQKNIGEQHFDIVIVYHNIALLQLDLKNCKQAKYYAEKALAIYQKQQQQKEKNNEIGFDFSFFREISEENKLLKSIEQNIQKAKALPPEKRINLCKDL